MSIHFTVENHVARVTIDRPDRLNAIDRATSAEMNTIWEKIEQDRDVHVVVLTGAGDRAFCAGADLKASTGMSGLEYWVTPPKGGFGGLSTRDTLDVPVIARVNGHVLGGGMVMLLGCDIVISSSKATFGFPEPRVGRLALEGGIQMLPRRIPHVLAMGMLLTGKRISADEAFRYGLVNEVVPPEELDATVDRWVADILACAPLAARAIKQMVRAGAHLSVKDADMLRVPALIESLRADEDAAEGRKAFQEQRKPQWKGR